MLDGLLWGRYTVEIWHAESGDIVDTVEVEVENGQLRVDLPKSAEPLAIRVKRLGELPVLIDIVPQDE